MARSPNKPAETVKATVAAAAGAGANVAPVPAAAETPTHVRLLGSGTISAGVFLPIGKALEIGVEIPAVLAEARLAAGTAEPVLGTAVSAKTLRDAVSALVGDLRDQLAAFDAKFDQAADADLAELIRGDLFGAMATDSSREKAEALETALYAHRAACEAEGLEPSGDGEDAA